MLNDFVSWVWKLVHFSHRYRFSKCHNLYRQAFTFVFIFVYHTTFSFQFFFFLFCLGKNVLQYTIFCDIIFFMLLLPLISLYYTFLLLFLLCSVHCFVGIFYFINIYVYVLRYTSNTYAFIVALKPLRPWKFQSTTSMYGL